MDMEVTAWKSMYHTMHAQQERRPFSKATLRRMGGFAQPHRSRLGRFLLLSVATAVLAAATLVLAGRVVDAIVQGNTRARFFETTSGIGIVVISSAER